MKNTTESTQSKRETFHLVNPLEMYTTSCDLTPVKGFRVDVEILQFDAEEDVYLLHSKGALLIVKRERFQVQYLLPDGEEVTVDDDEICGFLIPNGPDAVRPYYYLDCELGDETKQWVNDWWSSLPKRQRDGFLANLKSPGPMPEVFVHDACNSTTTASFPQPHKEMKTLAITHKVSTPHYGSRNWVKSLKEEWIWTIASYPGQTAVLISCGKHEIAWIGLDDDGDVADLGNSAENSANYTRCDLGEAAYGDFLAWADRNREQIQAAFQADDSDEHNLFA